MMRNRYNGMSELRMEFIRHVGRVDFFQLFANIRSSAHNAQMNALRRCVKNLSNKCINVINLRSVVALRIYSLYAPMQILPVPAPGHCHTGRRIARTQNVGFVDTRMCNSHAVRRKRT